MHWTTASIGTSVGFAGAGVFALVVALGLAVFAGGDEPVALQSTDRASSGGTSPASIVAATGLSLVALGAVGVATTIGIILAPNSRDIDWEGAGI